MNKIVMSLAVVCLFIGTSSMASDPNEGPGVVTNQQLVTAIQQSIASLKAEREDFIAKSKRFAEKDPKIPSQAAAITDTIDEIAVLYEKIVANKTGKIKETPAVSFAEQLKQLNQLLVSQTEQLNASIARIKKDDPEWALSEANKNALNVLEGLNKTKGNLEDDWVMLEK